MTLLNMVSSAYSEPKRIAYVTGVKHDRKFLLWPGNLTLAVRRTRTQPGIVKHITHANHRRRAEVNQVTRHDLRPPFIDSSPYY